MKITTHTHKIMNIIGNYKELAKLFDLNMLKAMGESKRERERGGRAVCSIHVGMYHFEFTQYGHTDNIFHIHIKLSIFLIAASVLDRIVRSYFMVFPLLLLPPPKRTRTCYAVCGIEHEKLPWLLVSFVCYIFLNYRSYQMNECTEYVPKLEFTLTSLVSSHSYC